MHKISITWFILFVACTTLLHLYMLHGAFCSVPLFVHLSLRQYELYPVLFYDRPHHQQHLGLTRAYCEVTKEEKPKSELSMSGIVNRVNNSTFGIVERIHLHAQAFIRQMQDNEISKTDTRRETLMELTSSLVRRSTDGFCRMHASWM